MKLKSHPLFLYFIILETMSVTNCSTVTEKSNPFSTVQVPLEANCQDHMRQLNVNDNFKTQNSNLLHPRFSAPDDSSESDITLIHHSNTDNNLQPTKGASFSPDDEDRLDFKAIELKPAYMLSFDRARESRRFNIFNQLWTRPRASPLYLVNGTVCRFLNNVPICTTLQTTGLMRK